MSVYLIIFAVILKFGAVFAAMPDPIVGGVLAITIGENDQNLSFIMTILWNISLITFQDSWPINHVNSEIEDDEFLVSISLIA